MSALHDALKELEQRRAGMQAEMDAVDSAIAALKSALPFTHGLQTSGQSLNGHKEHIPAADGVEHQRVAKVLKRLKDEGPQTTKELAVFLGEGRLLVKPALYRMLKTHKLKKIGVTNGMRWALP